MRNDNLFPKDPRSAAADVLATLSSTKSRDIQSILTSPTEQLKKLNDMIRGPTSREGYRRHIQSSLYTSVDSLIRDLNTHRYEEMLNAALGIDRHNDVQALIKRALGHADPVSSWNDFASTFDLAQKTQALAISTLPSTDPLQDTLRRLDIAALRFALRVAEPQSPDAFESGDTAGVAANDAELEPAWKEIDRNAESLNQLVDQLRLENEGPAQHPRPDMMTVLMLIIALAALLQDAAKNVHDHLEAKSSEARSEQDREALTRHFAREEALQERLNAALELLAERVPSPGPRYTAGDRSVRVKSSTTGGVMVGVLAPGQEVIVTEQRGRWVHVRFQVTDKQHDAEGWVLKHYLRRAPNALQGTNSQ
ncbi:SH3 domain-containing protein [Lysobacter enzymogenes]|uniref:SH3 domain-containing protein n=1 Tax=Lysobacter enzymogenes TaxID=69 RepID=UPI00089A4CE9|nr:SH3 domain-containing protein [Lysobacter enzymogenes]SDW85231.1 SH3 domain-containing protein [Lysobacter enzymogenes]